MGVVIHDANMEMHGRVSFEADGPERTRITITTDIPGLDESRGEFLSTMMNRTIVNVKELAEGDL